MEKFIIKPEVRFKNYSLCSTYVCTVGPGLSELQVSEPLIIWTAVLTVQVYVLLEYFVTLYVLLE